MLKRGIKRKFVLSLVITTLIVMIIFFVILDRYLKDFSINEAEGMTNRILILCVLIFLTLTITIYILSDRIVKPIKKLSSKIAAFASGDYSVRSDIKTNDEIGHLAGNFNILADKINEQILSIEQHNKNLEKNMKERTEALLKALDAIKEKDKKLNRAEKINSLNAIVSSIAHEINNPLAIISGNIQLIESKAKAIDPEIQKKLTVANKAIERIANLIDEINFFSAIKDISTASLSFGNLLAAVVEKVIPEGLPIYIDGVEEDRIDSNAHLLAVSMENILKNSVEMIRYKNVGSNGKIDIRYFRDSPYFTVEVMDNAGGIKEPEKIFEPFYTTFSEKKGLGLTFVYHAVQALNGDIVVENVGDGAKVSVMLPIEIPGEDEKLWLP